MYPVEDTALERRGAIETLADTLPHAARRAKRLARVWEGPMPPEASGGSA